jgi:hypothetical protein
MPLTRRRAAGARFAALRLGASIPVETQKVEGDQRGLRSAALVKSAWKSLRPSSLSATALPSMRALSQARPRNRRGDSRESVGEVRAATALDLDALALLPGEDR